MRRRKLGWTAGVLKRAVRGLNRRAGLKRAGRGLKRRAGLKRAGRGLKRRVPV